jgi:hypothetical protein
LKEDRGKEEKKDIWKILIFLMMNSLIYGSQELNKENNNNLHKIKMKMEKLILMPKILNYNSTLR